MTAKDAPQIERERQDADRRYNDALAALDRELNAATVQTAVDRTDTARLATALLVFLQQITGFVDTKDREVAATASARVDALEPAIESIGELRAQMAMLQRGVQMLQRTVTSHPNVPQDFSPARTGVAPPNVAQDFSPARTDASQDLKYLGFEDQFRGSADTIAERQRAYLPLFAGASDVVDVGCGRGEFLAALGAAGITARGVDANREMAAVARERGLDVTDGDALSFLAALPDASLGGLMAAQVVEHLEPAYLLRLLDTAFEKLRPGAPVIIETINAACWLAFFSSYIRDFTHVRPIHPETLQYLLRASGFTRVTLQYSAPVPDDVRMKPANLPAEVLNAADPSSRALQEIAHTVNRNAAILNNLMFTHLDYAAIGYRV
jgi:O-antigen chain-terminating methyltransferase